ncbi:DUF6882 domain-containing protein [Pseudomonas viridiflava]|uniref:DUF6882 domain-containing protein n=1 Tax=Pseudomonas viridiflava TaxID=33069 RepID=UPI000F039C5A|nr:DUF6882 domain-containing protein [Pseudomonas viridiflava]
MLEQTFEHLLETAMADLMAKQEQLSRDYGLGNMARWWLDQEAATVRSFDENDRLAVEGQIINIGSFSPRHGSWLWAWSNPTVLTALREKALPLKQLQAISGAECFGAEQAIQLEDESMAWELAAVAVHHLNALGCYRAPTSSDGPVIFLAITHLRHISH